MVTTQSTTAARVSAVSRYPTMIAVRLGAPSMSRRANPFSKSDAIPKPVKTPPNALACRSTKQNWNAV